MTKTLKILPTGLSQVKLPVKLATSVNPITNGRYNSNTTHTFIAPSSQYQKPLHRLGEDVSDT